MECNFCGRNKAREGKYISEFMWIFHCGHHLCLACYIRHGTLRNNVTWCTTLGCEHPGRFKKAFKAHIPLSYETAEYEDDLLHDLHPSYKYVYEKHEEEQEDSPAVVGSYMNSSGGPSTLKLVQVPIPEIFENIASEPMVKLSKKFKFPPSNFVPFRSSFSASDFKERCVHCGRNKPIVDFDILRLDCGHILCYECLVLSESAYREKKCPFFRCQVPYKAAAVLAVAWKVDGYTVRFVIESLNDAKDNKPWRQEEEQQPMPTKTTMPGDGNDVPSSSESPKPVTAMFPPVYILEPTQESEKPPSDFYGNLPDSW